jgi:hypothetical protein
MSKEHCEEQKNSNQLVELKTYVLHESIPLTSNSKAPKC